jgi:hypothetical protein
MCRVELGEKYHLRISGVSEPYEILVNNSDELNAISEKIAKKYGLEKEKVTTPRGTRYVWKGLTV